MEYSLLTVAYNVGVFSVVICRSGFFNTAVRFSQLFAGSTGVLAITNNNPKRY